MAASSSAEPGDARARVSESVPRTFLAGDGLRAIAAIAVLVLHAAIVVSLAKHAPGFAAEDEHPGQYRAIAGGAAPLLALMRLGIYIFFALSGYLLSRGFLAAYTLGTPCPPIVRYARNRVLRIVPAFWVVMGVYLTWNHAWRAGGVDGLLATFGFAQNYDHTAAAVIPQAWTLDIEVAFYALIPIVAVIVLAARRPRRGTPARRLRLVLGVLAAAYAGSLALKHTAGRPVDHTYNLGGYLFAFIPGVALAAIEPFAAPRLRERPDGSRWAWAALGAGAALLALYVYAPAGQYGLRLLLATLGCGAVLAAPLTLQWATGSCWRVLDNRPMRWLGQRSYGIYLIHLGLMGHVLVRIGTGHSYATTFLALTAASALATIVAADVLWRLVERPILQRRLPWRGAEFATPGSLRAG
jgi:peptidoglycan/LPS O-acetylase OafA/YrhL